MRSAHPTETAVGIEYYVSDVDGVGGRLRERNEHFRVRELERFDVEPLDAPAGAYPHLVFRATLSGWDTNDFASRLSDALGVSRERISWAGTKDKRASTTQLFSIAGFGDELDDEGFGEDDEGFEGDGEGFGGIDGVEIDVLGRSGRSLEFGDLAGNAFDIVVSDVDRPENAGHVTEALRSFGGCDPGSPSVAVPNFFGQQRFGSYRPVTHEVGFAIVREEWREAVMSYVGNPSATEPEGTRSAREFVERTRDWQAALERFPNRLGYERSMLHALAEFDGDPGPEQFEAALERLPTNLQRLFVHAAQSFAFNRMLSERLERGLPFDRPIEGDVACFVDRDAPEGLVLPDTDRLQRVDARRIPSVTRHCERNRAFVTAPLVGTETTLADGEQGEIERAVLDDLDVAPRDFALPGEFHSTGTRRAILVRTDLEVDADPLTLSFSLPKGSYATVLLREYLKVDPVRLG